MANDTDGTAKSLAARGIFTPEYARGYQDGHREGFAEGVRAALEQIENLSQQEPPIPADIPNLGEEDDLHILGLTPRALGVLQRGGVMTITQLRQYDRNRKLWGLYGMGPMLMDEIIEKCAARGISIRKF